MRENHKETYEDLFGELSEHLHQSLVQFHELTELPSYLKQTKTKTCLTVIKKQRNRSENI